MTKAIAEFIGNNANALPDVVAALVSGDESFLNSSEALRASEQNRAVFSLAAEMIAHALDDVRTATVGQKGYLTGRIVFEVLTAVGPGGAAKLADKAAVLGQVVNKPFISSRLSTASKTSLNTLRTGLQTTKMCFVAGTPVLSKRHPRRRGF